MSLVLAILFILPDLARADDATPADLPATAVDASAATASPVGNRAGDSNPLLYEAILPEHRERIYAETAGTLSRYRISAAMTPAGRDEPAALSGTVNLRYVNETTAPQSEIYFRLYPNAPAYNEAEMTVSDLLVAGTPVLPVLSMEDTVMAVTLPNPLGAWQAVDLELSYTAVVPVRPTRTYGIYAVDPTIGTISLAHWFPLLAGYDEFGWSLDPVSRNGDPIFSTTALFDVRFTTPDAWEVAATGVEVDRITAGGQTTRHLVSGPVRDFTVVTSDQLVSVSRDVAGTTVTSFFHPTRAAGGEAVLDYGANALLIFTELLTPYPYREMGLVEVELYGAGGVEFPQLMFMARSLYDNDYPRNERYLEFVTAHEVGHQWFFALVGNNQHRDAFIDEGLVEFLSTEVYFSARYGEEAGRRQFALEVLLWYFGVLQSGRDLIVDQPTAAFRSSADYAAATYAKGAIGFAAIHDLIGPEPFFAALRDYATAYEFGVGSPDALLLAFKRSSGRDVEPVWSYWFEQENGAEKFDDEDYLELMVELGLR